MIDFYQISCGSDCTGPYFVSISKPMTVREFINELLSTYPKEWGYIGIYKPKTFYGDPCCEYSHGKLLYSLPDKCLDQKIEQVEGSGGWSRSDFLLKVEE